MSDQPNKRVPWAMIIGGVLVVYFGLFTVILVDELLLGTGWIGTNSPDWLVMSIRTAYAPFFWLVTRDY